MIVLALFVSTFLLVMALGAQSLLVNNGRYLGAFFNSLVIGTFNLIGAQLDWAPSHANFRVAWNVENCNASA